MKTFSTSLLFLLHLVSGVHGQDDCVPIEQLGTPSMENYNYSIAIEVDDENEYTLTIDFKHDENLPTATNPTVQCDPSIVPPDLAEDGIPYFGFRWYYETVSEEIKAITGIDHVSIDWNACGHPPINVFTAAHYDLHIYRETPDFRTCMTCTTIPGAPVCDPTPGAQTTDNGKAFFDIATLPDNPRQPRNMPEGFTVGPDDMIPLMGGHAWNYDRQPANVTEWTEPVWVMGSYGGSVPNFEPMIPMAFVSGTDDKVYEEELSYEGKTMEDLPSRYSVEYSGETGVVTVTLKGTSLVAPVEDEEESGAMSASQMASSAAILIGLVFAIL